MIQLQLPGVQSLSLKPSQTITQFYGAGRRQFKTPSVELITYKGVIQVRHVHANLMCAAGFQIYLYVSMATKSFNNPVMG
jgi:hypothetical protein